MDAKWLKYMTTPAMVSYAELIGETFQKIKRAEQQMNNALENDKYAVVGREAQKITDLVAVIEAALKEITIAEG